MSFLNWQNIYFAEPEKLQLFYVAVILLLVSIFGWLLKFLMRPKITFSSKYPFIGTMKLWFSLSIVLSLCIFAYARPFLAKGQVVVKKGSAEIVFLIDYSSSMFLKDTGWARIDIAAREIKESLSGGTIKEGDRAAILVFGKLVSPRLFLTYDLEALANEADKIGRPANLMGSDLFWGSAVATTFKRVHEILDRQDMFVELHGESENWRPKSKENRLIIIFSDGDFFNYGDDELEKYYLDVEKQDLEIQLRELKKRNIPIYSVGIGSRSGAKLTDILKEYKPNYEYDFYLQEELKGQISRLNMANLEHLSSATGGKSFSMEDFRSDAGGFIRNSIDRHRSIFVEPVPGEKKEELWRYFLLGALTVFIVGMGITKF
ncbi:MAG: hypothetical protein COV30_02240 [Candidatus Yanofskybacteria bacterium CG10_big_fil_rev_8_21_14_0_10_37_15]|uniref:VWFA domain-containing protein n=1 Tax=Candidatus Yanofskybacteria bacterium CG10_big_fil_rev_8_21_14_0_10_37_15 TaxID=1975097 RepID=A0A2H0R6R6_9BACT|nr:MAG: hypothetical protein COV30_02240 [Candidatus Yanofskybacteria bacterium CG10_big_fil_rev_8_21_14_0_10_37_15]